MKRKLLFVVGLLFALQPAISQSREDKLKIENDKKYFDDSDKDFDVKEVPEKWKTESAVILCQKLSFSYTTENNLSTDNYHIEEYVRKRIKLLDKAAVEEFSKFYFLSSASVGIHIVKPNGTVVDVDLSAAISEESQIPSIYRSYAVFESYKKLAIPGLEEGDILDYYYATKNITMGRDGETKAFRAFIFSLNASYPIVNQIVFYNVDRNYFINFTSTNNAPNLEEGTAGTNYLGKVKENIKTYILKDKDRDKIAQEKWVYQYRNYPTIKFQVVSGTKNAFKDSEYFLGTRGEAKSKVTKQELVLSMSRRFLNESVLEKYFKGYTVPFIVDYIKKKHKGVTDPEIIMTEAFYCMRYQYPNVIGGYPFNWTEDKNDYIGNDSRINDELFCEVMLAVAKKFKIKPEVFIAIPRSMGTFEEVLIPSELNIGVRINGKLLLSPPKFYSVHTTLDPLVEGCDAIVFVPEDDPEKSTYTEFVLPISKSSENIILYNLKASISEDMEFVDVKRSTTHKGNYIESAPVYTADEDDVLYEDKKKFDVDFKEKPEEKMMKKEKEAKAKEEEDRAEYAKKVKEYLKENTDGDFEIEEYHSYEVKNLGREPESNEFVLDEHFTVKNIINKAGKNYTINVGLLLGEQVEIKEKERDRKTDIDIAFSKSIVSEISLLIPEGYTVEALDELNINVDNSSMAFKSVAKMEGNTLKISVKKEYKVFHDSKSNWKNWTEVVDAAYNFTQKKVVLKKG